MILDTHYVVVRCLENFLGPLEVQKTPQKQGVAHQKWPANPPRYWVWNLKNDRLRTFMAVESFLRIVWPPRLLSEIAMTLNNSSNIDNDGIRPLENFLRAPQVETFLQKNLTFYLIFALNQLEMGMKPKKWPATCVYGRGFFFTHRMTTLFAFRDCYDPKQLFKHW